VIPAPSSQCLRRMTVRWRRAMRWSRPVLTRSRIEILAQSGTPQDATFHYEHNDEGIWGAIKRFFMPDEDTHIYAEGIRRGYAMLVVHTGAGDQEQIISLLESQDAVDVETHAANWRQSGWSGMHEGHASWEQSQRSRSSAGTVSAPPATGASSGIAATGTAGQEEVIPVYEEQFADRQARSRTGQCAGAKLRRRAARTGAGASAGGARSCRTAPS
jgi:hypothetical protein